MFTVFELIILFTLGLAVGSFVNVIILRLRSGEQWMSGRSHCVWCQAVLTIADLIPLFSFVWLKGRCRSCKKNISWQYPLVELATALLFLLAYGSVLATLHVDALTPLLFSGMMFPLLLLIRNFFFIGILIILFVTDLRWFALYDSIIIVGSGIALASNMIMPTLFSPQYIFPAELNLFIAALIPSSFFGAQYVLSRGLWIGSGDIFLGAMMGCMLGFPQVIVALFLAYCSGALVGSALLLGGKKTRKSEIPFGTFLTASTMLMLFYGDQIMVIVSQTLLL